MHRTSLLESGYAQGMCHISGSIKDIIGDEIIITDQQTGADLSLEMSHIPFAEPFMDKDRSTWIGRSISLHVSVMVQQTATGLRERRGPVILKNRSTLPEAPPQDGN